MDACTHTHTTPVLVHSRTRRTSENLTNIKQVGRYITDGIPSSILSKDSFSAYCLPHLCPYICIVEDKSMMGVLSLVHIIIATACVQSTYAVPAYGSASSPPYGRIMSPGGALKRQSSSGMNASCTYGPTSRNCWSEGYDISTDSETSWPVTGVTKSVGLSVNYGLMSATNQVLVYP